jgi:hypothetical protein
MYPFPNTLELDRTPAPAASWSRTESQRDDSIYASPVAVAVFFAIQHAGYSPSRALQLSGIIPSKSFNPITM